MKDNAVEGPGFFLDLSLRTYLMGILNVTPDSFSDGGAFFDHETAVTGALEMVDEGADIIDIGGESTRPGSAPVPLDEELRRVIPVIEKVCRQTRTPVSIDTRKAEVAQRAMDVGARIINDVSALTADPSMVEVVARAEVPVVLMHAKGTPETMQRNPDYKDTVAEIRQWLADRVETVCEQGVERGRIIVDPGIGFGKRPVDNLLILKSMKSFASLGCPVLVGPSRKRFIGDILDLPETERMEGTAAAVALAIAGGADIVRVHDVRAMSRVARVADAIVKSELN